MERLKRKFRGVGDDGQEYEILEFVDYIDVAGGGKIPGMKRLATSTGISLNYLSKGVYKRFDNNVVIRSDDPNAP